MSLFDFFTAHWHSMVVVAVVAFAVYRVYKKWYKLKIW